MCCSVLQCVAFCCNALQCVAVCCSVLQCVVVYLLERHHQIVRRHLPFFFSATHRNSLQQYNTTHCNEPQHTYLLQRQHQIVRCHLRFFFLLNCICSQRPAVRRHVAIDAVYSNIRRHFRISFRFHLRIFFSAARQRKRGSRPYYSVLQCVAVCCSVLYILKCQRANTSFI